MKRVLVTIAACLLLLPAFAQEKKKTDGVSFAYDAFFQYCFDNREFAPSENLFMNSETLNLARLAPAIGLEVRSGRKVKHSLVAGADILREMGNGNEYSREFNFWYSIEARGGGRRFTGRAGMFPRRYSLFCSQVPTVFLSDKFKIYDSNIEGILLQMRGRKGGMAELGLDWMGMLGSNRRERFQIFSYGCYPLSAGIGLGWSASLYHFANTLEYRGVVDNVLLSPFVSWTGRSGSWEYQPKLSLLLGVHQDRIKQTGLESTYGALLSQRLTWKSLSILSDSYYGTGQMPYYDDIDAGGNVYGSDLYFGCPFYKASGLYERLEFYWKPLAAGPADIRVGAVAHFNGNGFCGWQQKLGVIFDLERTINKR